VLQLFLARKARDKSWYRHGPMHVAYMYYFSRNLPQYHQCLHDNPADLSEQICNSCFNTDGQEWSPTSITCPQVDQ